jgi:E3 ubiquitin-protein ligase RFWD3
MSESHTDNLTTKNIKTEEIFTSSIPSEVSKEDGVTCPICFGEYTSSGNHRIVSMKCGHLFGNSCILEWYKKRKIVLCPICGTKCSKSQLRLIFSSKVVALNHEKELKLVEQYISEFNLRNKLQEEVNVLKTEIEVLKLNNKTNKLDTTGCTCSIKKRDSNYNLYLKIKCTFSTKGSVLVYDQVNGFIVVSTIKDNHPCLIKYYDSGMTGTKIFNDTGILSNMKYLEGNIVLSIGTKLYILNMYNCNIIFEDTLSNRITAIEGFSSRDRLVVADDRGYITVFDLGINKRSIKICNVTIHSLYCTDKNIYIGTVFNVYKIEINGLWEEFVNGHDDVIINIVNCVGENKTCINIFGENSSVVLAYRLKNNKIVHYLVDDTQEKYINLTIRQISKFKEKIYKDKLYLVDQFENKLLVVNLEGEKVFEYQVEENMICFDVYEGILVVLSEVFMYVFK